MFRHWLGHCCVMLLEAGIVLALVGAGIEVGAKLATIAVGTVLVGAAVKISQSRAKRKRVSTLVAV